MSSFLDRLAIAETLAAQLAAKKDRAPAEQRRLNMLEGLLHTIDRERAAEVLIRMTIQVRRRWGDGQQCALLWRTT